MKTAKKTTKILAITITVVIIIIGTLAIYKQIALKIEAEKIVPNGQMVDVGGYKIHVYSQGNNDSKPVLVFLSGFGTAASVYDFKLLYSKLSDDYKIAVVEKTGYGYSDTPDINRDIDTTENACV